VGDCLTHAEDRGMIVMRKNDIELHSIDAASGADLAQRPTSAKVALARFDEKGERMLVLTDDQQYRILHVGAKHNQ
jgi:hypothetical protein